MFVLVHSCAGSQLCWFIVVLFVIWILRRLFLKRERIFDDDEKSGGLGFCRGGCDYCMGKWGSWGRVFWKTSFLYKFFIFPKQPYPLTHLPNHLICCCLIHFLLYSIFYFLGRLGLMNKEIYKRLKKFKEVYGELNFLFN